MNELTQLALWIEASKSSIRRDNVKPIKDITPLILAYKTVVGMRMALINHAPLTSTASRIGKMVCLDIEMDKNIKDEQLPIIYVDIGYHLLNILFNNRKLEARRGKKTRDPYTISCLDDTFIDNMLYAIDAEPLDIKIKSKPVFEEPEEFTSFNHPIAGELVRKINPQARKHFKYDICPGVFDAINKYMKIPYIVNTDLLDVYKQCRKDDNLFTFRNKTLNKDQFIGLKREQTAVLDIAEGINLRTFWQHAFYDFRGRLYSSLNYFSPQGSKLAKSLFYMSNAEPIGNEGWNWLLFHAANTWGEDKKPLDDRIKFAESKLNEWMIWAAEPVHYRQEYVNETTGEITSARPWTKADSPFEFLAVIMEIHKALKYKDKYDYPSGLIISFDATCSGLQVLSALTRDRKAGILCNLTNGPVRGDYYKMIADSIWKECTYDDNDVQMAKEFKDIYEDYLEAHNAFNAIIKNKLNTKEVKDKAKVDKRALSDLWAPNRDAAARIFWARPEVAELKRSIVKRPCMTYFYSCQPKTMAKSLLKDFRSEEEFHGIMLSYCYWLCYRIYNQCKISMPIATEMMETFIDMGLADYEEGRDFTIIAPHTSFLFMQNYRNIITKDLYVKYKGRKMKLKVMTGLGEKLDYQKIVNATAPNATHMFDSQIVAAAILRAKYDLNIIHDSFGTIPAHAGELFEDIRYVFVKLFDIDLLDDIMRQKDYESNIELGDLDITDVYDDEFTFN